MKNSIISIIILEFVTTAVTGQNYFAFPKNSATWSVTEYFHASVPWEDDCTTTHYGLNGDTVIEGINYNKLYATYNGTAFNPQASSYEAAVREDTAKKVWIRLPTDSTDILYYDFALDSGDVFCFDYFNMGCYQVQQVIYTPVNGVNRRTIIFDNGNHETWIEGIGSTTGWFEWQFIGSWSWNLSCYKEGQALLYSNGACYCGLYTGIIQPMENTFSIFPNPAASRIFVYSNNHSNYPHIIEIYSTRGEMIKSIEAGTNGTTIDLHELTDGIYLLLIVDNDNNRWLKKIIKTAP